MQVDLQAAGQQRAAAEDRSDDAQQQLGLLKRQLESQQSAAEDETQRLRAELSAAREAHQAADVELGQARRKLSAAEQERDDAVEQAKALSSRAEEASARASKLSVRGGVRVHVRTQCADGRVCVCVCGVDGPGCDDASADDGEGTIG